MKLLDSSKSTGLDGVGSLILKNCASAFASTCHLQRVSYPIDGNSRLLLSFSRVVGAMTYRMTEALRYCRLLPSCGNCLCTGSCMRI
jgi:hypothetical protein